MKIIPPITVTDATLISTNVSENAPTAYSAGTTYAAGDMVSYNGGSSLLLDQWASAQSSNTGHTPGVSGEEWWVYCGQAAAAYDAGTTYAAGDGAQIDAGGVHQMWWSVVDDNTGNAPQADAGDHWLNMGATNRWAMFDLALGFSTINSTLTRIATRWGEKIDVTLEPAALMDTVVAWVIDADSVQVTVTDAGSVVIYDETITLTGDAALEKWQLDGVPYLRPVSFEGVTFTAGSQVRVQIFKPGGVAICAELILGMAIDAGPTLAPATVGIQDYSVIQADEFGTFSVTPRAWHRKGSFTVLLAEDDVDPCMEMLTRFRGRPLQFIAVSQYRRAVVIFGFLRSFEQTLTFPDATALTIDLESI